MLPIAGGGKFISIGDRIRFPDDVTMGFVIGNHTSVILQFIIQHFFISWVSLENIWLESFLFIHVVSLILNLLNEQIIMKYNLLPKNKIKKKKKKHN